MSCYALLSLLCGFGYTFNGVPFADSGGLILVDSASSLVEALPSFSPTDVGDGLFYNSLFIAAGLLLLIGTDICVSIMLLLIAELTAPLNIAAHSLLIMLLTLLLILLVNAALPLSAQSMLFGESRLILGDEDGLVVDFGRDKNLIVVNEILQIQL